MVARHDDERVGPELGQPAPHPGEGRVHAQDQLAILGLRAGQELRRVGAGERPDHRHAVSLRTISSNALSASAWTSSRVRG